MYTEYQMNSQRTGSFYCKKPWAIGTFLKFGVEKMVITQKIEVGISSNFLHSIRTSICIRKCNKNLETFRSHFSKKPWAIAFAFFKKWLLFVMFITRKIT